MMSPDQPLNLESTIESRLFQNEEFLSQVKRFLAFNCHSIDFFSNGFFSSNVVFFSWKSHFAVMSVDDAKFRKESIFLPSNLSNFMKEIVQICEKLKKEQERENTPSVCLSWMFQQLLIATESS